MTEELGAISVGLRVGLGSLDADLARIQKKISPIAKEHTISFKVGGVNTSEVQKQIAAITRGKIDVKVGVTLATGAGSLLRRQLQAQVNAAGPIKVNVAANLSAAQVTAIRKQVAEAIDKQGGIRPTVRPGSTSTTTGSAATSSTVTPHERRVAEVQADAIVRRTKASTPATPTPARAARSAPSTPGVAAAPVTTPATPTPAAKPKTTRAKRGRPAVPLYGDEDVGDEDLQPSQYSQVPNVAYAHFPQGAVRANLGGATPTGPAMGVTYRRRRDGSIEVVPPGKARGLGKRLAKTAQRTTVAGMSTDTLKREKAHAAEVAPEDEEYASRPMQVRVPLTNDEQEFEERGRHGVRGAGRSGARVRNEPVLTASERQAIGDKQDVMSEEASTEAETRVRAPARKSGAYYGTPSANPRMRQNISKVQFGKFSPVLQQAYEALLLGDTDKARDVLRGFSGQLAGADPRQRKKFFRLFNDVERVPQHLLEQHAGVQALFAQISQEEAGKRVATAEEAVRAFPKPKGPVGGWPEGIGDQWKQALETQREARRFQMDVLRGMRPRAGGGRVSPARAAAQAKAAKGPWHGKPIEPGINWPADPETHFRAFPMTRLMDLAERRMGRRYQTTRDLMEAGFGPSSPERVRPHQLEKEAEALFDRLRGVSDTAFKGRAGGGRVTGLFPKAKIDSSLEPMLGGKQTLKELGRFKKEFPISAGKLREIRDISEKHPDKGGNAGVMDGGYTLAFNPGYIDKALKRKSGTSVAGRSGKVSDVVQHELGHVADYASGDVLRKFADAPASGYGAQSPAENAAELFTQRHGIRGFLTRRKHGDYFAAVKSFSKQEQAEFAENEKRRVAAEARIASFKGRAGGGAVEGPLQKRIRMAREAKNKYLVAETRDETFIGDSGKTEILKQPAHVRTFEESGKVLPYVPEWVRRGMPKDLTGQRAPGGRVFAGQLAAEPQSGLGAPYKKTREGFEGEREAIAAGQLGRGGGVQRVFVTNWPGGAAAARPGTVTAQPVAPGVAAGPTKERDLAAQIDKSLRRLIGATKPAKPMAAENEGPTIGSLSPEQKVSARIEAIGGAAPRELRSQLTDIRSRLSETTAQSPVRSLAPAIGQIVGTAFGRGELIKRLATARDLTAQATRAEGFYNRQVEEEGKLQRKLDQEERPEKREKLVAALEEQAKATKLAKTELTGLVGEADNAAKSADAFSLKIGTLIGNTTGIIGGTLLFGATLGAAQAGLSALSEIAGPAIERMTGFKNVTAETTKALAEQTRQQSGSVQTAIAMANAQAGLSQQVSQTVSPLLAQRAATEAGNLALVDGLKLVHSAIEIRRQNASLGGTDQGIAATTGGFFGSILGGIPSTQEQVVNELGKALPTGAEFAANKTATDFLAKQPKQTLGQALGNAFAVGPGNAVSPLTPISPTTAAAQVSDEFTKKLSESTVYIDTFQGALDKAGKNFVLDQQKIGESDTELAKRNTDAATAAKAFASAGLLDTAKLIRDTNLVIRDAQGNAVQTAEQARKFFTDINKSFTTPDVGELLKAMTDRVIPAALASIRAQGNLQRQVTVPAQFALGEIAQPTPGLKTSPLPYEAGLIGKGDTAGAAAVAKYKGMVGGAIDYINQQIAKGHDALVNLVPPDLRQEFTGILDEIASTGQQISQIQTGLAQQQLDLQVKDYNNQLRITKRSLQDAKDLQAGIAGATRDTVGGLEGQNVKLQRQLQLLSFELQQRQINFSVAAAGFVAPGTTPEERAARIEEAKKEAEYAQKQLDIQKQMASNQFRSLTLPGVGEVARQITDLNMQLGLLTQGRQLTIDTAAASKALDILNKKQALLVAQAGTYVEEGQKVVQAMLEATAEVQKQTGKGFETLLSQTAKAWGIFGQQAQLVLNALTGSAPSNPASTTKGHDAAGHVGGYAAGIVGDTLGPTQLTVGEAAGEKVAILRNPKLVPSSTLMGAAAGGSTGGGPLVQMTVIISGNSIREDTDLEQLAERVAQKTEDRLNQKTSLFGLRRA